MKIGYLLQQGIEMRKRPFSGPANHVYHVVRQLEKMGHEVRLINWLDGQIVYSDDLQQYEAIPVPEMAGGPRRLFERVVRRIQSTLKLPYANYFESLRFAYACRRALAGYDLLYERKTWMGFGGGFAAKMLGIPLVLEENGDHLADLAAKGMAPSGVQLRLSLWLMRRAMHRAAHVVASGEGWRRNFIQKWGYDAQRVTTIENGTELAHKLERSQLYHFQADAPPHDPVTLVYVGGFYAWHGIPVLLPALARALADGVRARLLLIGSGDGLAEAQQRVAELGLDTAVTFLGHLTPDQYAPILAGADFGVSPYCGWMEYSGLKILDYKAAGLPTLASGLEGMPPTLQHERTGLIVPPCDEDALYHALVRLCTDADLRRRMGQQARREAEEQHGWEETAVKIAAVFQQIEDRDRDRV
ncbi:MAG: glycosyltransferase family 4 protein [Anaerolineales bacterium]|nr:glycosyltransferase family 4 protein [Anaerolineales bacterium]